MPTLDATRAEILVYTFKEGLLSRVAHDLKLRFTDFELTVDLPGGEAEPQAIDAIERIALRVNPRSLRVVCAVKKGREDHGALSADDIEQVEQNVIEQVLHPDRFAELSFESTEITALRSGSRYRISGELQLHGARRRVEAIAELQGHRWLSEVTLYQPDYGIKPFKALLGSLKIKPEVRVRVSVPQP